MLSNLKLLLVEDSPDDADLLLMHLKKAGIHANFERVETETALLSALDNEWDTVICDYNLPKLNALSAISMLKNKRPEVPCIVVSGSIGEELAVETMRAGANDYILKDNLVRLVPVIERGLQDAQSRKEKKQIEDELRQAQKLEAIGQLAGGIAHDFNNILATILLQVDALKDGIDQKLKNEMLIEHIEKGLEQIKKSGLRATHLTRQLLAFSRKQVVQPKVLNLNNLISDMGKMLERVIEENIELQTNLKRDLKNIKVDPGHLEQILMNLVVNGRDAMPKGGKLKIVSQNSEIDAGLAKSWNIQPGSYVLLEVTDTGIGMSAEVQRRIFEPFFTTKPIGKGTGLGLSTVYGIVKQNKGLILVDSKTGKGTTFKIYFPTVVEELDSVNSMAQEFKNLRGNETILVVEDEKDLRELVSENLKNNGYNVFMASNGIEALELIKKQTGPIHLIITDVIMPQMGGLELAAQAKIMNKNTKILFQSGYNEESLSQNGIQSQDMHFLEKPYSIKVLLSKVRGIFS